MLSDARLKFANGRPVFITRIEDSDFSWLKAPVYALVIEDQIRANLRRDSEGYYSVEGGEIHLNPLKSCLSVDLLENGQSVLDEPFKYLLWDIEEDIAFYRLDTGKKVDPWEFRFGDNNSYAILCCNDILLDPPTNEWYAMFGGKAKLSLCRNGIPGNLKITIENEILWEAPTQPPGTDREKQVPPVIKALCDGGRLGKKVSVKLDVPNSIVPRRLKIGNQSLKVDTLPDGTFQANNLELLPGLDMSKNKTYLTGIYNGKWRTLPVTLSLRPVTGAVVQTISGLKPIDENKIIDKADLNGRPVYVSPPKNYSSALDDWAIMEGYNFCGRPKNKGVILSDSLYGFGEPLLLMEGPYNSQFCQPEKIAGGVIDTGEIFGVRPRDGGWDIHLRHDICLNNEYEVWVWYGDDELPEYINPQCCHSYGNYFHVPSNILDVEKMKIGWALSYKGEWLGSRWSDEYYMHRLNAIIEDTINWPRLACWLRWWRAPVLSKALKSSIMEKISEYRKETLLVWLGRNEEEYLDPRLKQTEGQHGWYEVIRSFYWNWQPGTEAAAELVKELGLISGDPFKDLSEGWSGYEELCRINPVMLATIIKTGLQVIYPGSTQSLRPFINILCNLIADLERNAGTSSLEAAKRNLLASAAESMKVDTAFIERVLLQEALKLINGELSENCNLRFSLEVQPLRSWLAIKLLQQLF